MKNPFFCFSILLVLLFFTTHTFSQTGSWKNFTNAKLINDIKGEGNYLWVGCPDGLVKFDTITGSKIYFNRVNSGIPSNNVTSIEIDSLGNKWIGTNEGALAKFDNTTWTVYNHLNSTLTSNKIVDLKFDKTGILWIAQSFYLVKFNGNAFTNIFSAPDKINQIDVDDSCHVWLALGGFASTNAGLFKYNGSTTQRMTGGNQSNFASGVIVRPNQTVLYTSDWGIYIFNAISYPIYSPLQGGSFNRCFKDYANNIYITSDNGIFELPNTGPLVYFTDTTISTTLYRANCIYADNNNKWLGLNEDGLSKYNGNGFQYLDLSNAPFDYFNTDFLSIDQLNQKWLFDYRDLSISCYNDNLIYHVSSDSFPGRISQNVFTDKNGVSWFVNRTGVHRFDGQSWQTYDFTNSPATFTYGVWNQCTQDTSGNLWIVNTNRILKFDRNNSWQVFDTTNSPIGKINYAPKIYCSNQNKIYLFDGNNLIIYDGLNWTVIDSTTDPNFERRIQNVVTDNAGNLWMATYTGLVKYDGTSCLKINLQNSPVPSVPIYAIAYDSLHDGLWISPSQFNNYFFNYNFPFLISYKQGTWTTFPFKDFPISDPNIIRIYIDKFSNKWMHSLFGSLGIYNENGVTSTDVEEFGNDDFILYPNPTSGTIKLRTDKIINRIEVFDLTGKLMKVLNDSELLNHELYIGKYNNGVYFLNIYSHDKTFIRPVFLEK